MTSPPLQTHVKKVPDGEVRYYYVHGNFGKNKTVYLQSWTPGFILISRTVLPNCTARVEVKDNRILMPPVAGDHIFPYRIPMLTLIFPEGGPVNFTVGRKTMRIHPHQYGLTYPDDPYVAETVPQRAATHRMIIHMSARLQRDVWHDVTGRSRGQVPRFDVGTGTRSPYLNNLLRLAYQQCASPRAKGWITVGGCLRELLHWLIYHHPHTQRPSLGTPVLQPVSDPQIITGLDFLHTHVADRQAVRGAAAAAGMHVNTFRRRMEKSLGINPVEYLQRFRMERAQGLLRESDASIEAACDEVGYESLSHFRKAFKDATGLSPLNFRQRHHVRAAPQR